MLFKAVNLRKTFDKRFKLEKTTGVVDAGFCLNPGETIGIVGESGAGKTTLALMLAGVVRPDSGHIFFEGNDIWTLGSRERRQIYQRIQMIFQHPETAFNPKWTILRSLVEPCRIHRIPVLKEAPVKWVQTMGLGREVLYRYPGQLSGGELQRIAIARAVSLSPAVLVLDEPVSMLDMSTQAQIIRLLEKIQSTTRAGHIYITHDMEIARLICKRIYTLENRILSPLF
jgi:peptide/nickel transport system ATP-binding protein